MQKFNTMAVAFDNSQIEKTHRLIDSLIKKIKEYNKEVKESNKLLKEQETLRNNLNIKVKNGKAVGLVEGKA